MKRNAYHFALLMLVFSWIACSERPREGDDSRMPAAANGETAAPAEGDLQETLDALEALGAAVKLDDKGNVIVVQVGNGEANDDTAELLVGMQSLKS